MSFSFIYLIFLLNGTYFNTTLTSTYAVLVNISLSLSLSLSIYIYIKYYN